MSDYYNEPDCNYGTCPNCGDECLECDDEMRGDKHWLIYTCSCGFRAEELDELPEDWRDTLPPYEA